MYLPKELAEQANMYAHDMHIEWLGAENFNPAWQKCRDEHFATLIIQRCVLVINSGSAPKEGHLPGDDLKEYFGLDDD